MKQIMFVCKHVLIKSFLSAIILLQFSTKTAEADTSSELAKKSKESFRKEVSFHKHYLLKGVSSVCTPFRTQKRMSSNNPWTLQFDMFFLSFSLCVFVCVLLRCPSSLCNV